MSRVAIIGSCITRDLWPIRGDGVAALLYISRTSLPSLFSRCVAGFIPEASPPNGLTKYQHQAVVADIEKRALAALVAHQPTHIIFDFIDERFDLLSTGESLLTHSWELQSAGYLDRPPLTGARRVPRLSEPCLSLWSAAAGEMAAFLRQTPLREAQLILHEAQWAERYRDGSGRHRDFQSDVEIWPGRPTTISEHNHLLKTYESIFLDLNPGAKRISAPKLRVADAGHRWGLSPFHYVDAYYDQIWDQLRSAGVTLERQTPEAAPSAPAA